MKEIKRNLLRISASALIFVSGYLTSNEINKKKTKYAGNLRIDRSEPNEPPKMFLELQTDLNDISKAKVIKLKVVNENYLKK